MINLLVFWFLPLLGGLAGITLALVWREHYRSTAGLASGTSFELVGADNSSMNDPVSHARFLERYFDALTGFVREAEKSILIVDYLAHHRSLTAQDDEVLVRLYEKYYQALEEVVRTKGIKYTRLVQLPLPKVELDRNEKIADSLSLMFVETFHHLDRMLEAGNDFHLYVLDAAFRPYSFILIDDDAILTEYDRYTIQGTSVADHIIINKARGTKKSTIAPQVLELVSIQRGWCTRLVSKDKPVSLSEFRDLAAQLVKKNLREVEVQLALSEQEYRKLLMSSGIDESSVRSVKRHGPEAVRKNMQGSEKKLSSVKPKILTESRTPI